MSYTYNYTASQCPLPQTPLATLYASSSPPAPVVGTAVSGGTSAAAQGLPTIINAAQVRGNLLGRYGGGAYAIWTGLDLSISSGLTLAISAGVAGLDGPSELTAATTLAQVDGVTNRNWISRAGTLNSVSNLSVSPGPLSPPDAASPWCYLGACPCAGSILSIDRSGVFTQYQGNLLYRRTADEDEPNDAALLPATVRFLTRTVSGLWLWDGEAYTSLGVAAATLSDALTTTSSNLDELQRQFRLQLRHTFECWGLEFIHPELYQEVDFS